MAFDPLAFLEVARALTGAPQSEAGFRTAIGRAYYAVFLLGRERTGVRAKKDVHKRVLQAIGHRLGKHTRDQLDSLRLLRSRADYDVLAVISDGDWQKAEALVQHLLPKIRSI